MVLNCEPGKICWKSPGCECVGCSPCAEALLGCPCSPDEGSEKFQGKGKGMGKSCANLRHRNGAVSFPDVFPCTAYGLRAEWLLASRVAVQEAALA